MIDAARTVTTTDVLLARLFTHSYLHIDSTFVGTLVDAV
jgi:hypothetical protein